MKSDIVCAIALVSLTLVSPAANAGPPTTSSLVVSVNGGGVVTSYPAGIICPSDCEEAFTKGARVTLTASPATGQTFLGWGGACAGTSTACSIKVSAPLTTVTADFTSSPPSPPAPVAQTGATKCGAADGQEIPCAGTGQDGEFSAGVAWPSPRFSDNGDGTLTDTLSGLTWTKNVCGSFTWDNAAAYAASLASGNCELSDGSAAGDWRMPNVAEVLGLVDWGTGMIAECPFYYGSPDCDLPLWTNTPSSESSEFGNTFYAVILGEVQLARWIRTSALPLLAVKRQ